MTETTTRIRWHAADDGEATGYVGSLDQPVFRIWPPDDKGDCLLFAYIPGQQGDLYHGATIDDQQAVAERLLEEFVSSLGAVFPGPSGPPPGWAAEWDSPEDSVYDEMPAASDPATPVAGGEQP